MTTPIRPARDDDSGPLSALIAASFAEYPGCVFVEDELPELRRPASYFAAKGGMLWIVDGPEERIAGSLGVRPVSEQNAVELAKVYVDPPSAAPGWRRPSSPGHSILPNRAASPR